MEKKHVYPFAVQSFVEFYKYGKMQWPNIQLRRSYWRIASVQSSWEIPVQLGVFHQGSGSLDLEIIQDDVLVWNKVVHHHLKQVV